MSFRLRKVIDLKHYQYYVTYYIICLENTFRSISNHFLSNDLYVTLDYEKNIR